MVFSGVVSYYISKPVHGSRGRSLGQAAPHLCPHQPLPPALTLCFTGRAHHRLPWLRKGEKHAAGQTVPAPTLGSTLQVNFLRDSHRGWVTEEGMLRARGSWRAAFRVSSRVRVLDIVHLKSRLKANVLWLEILISVPWVALPAVWALTSHESR